MVVEIKTKDEFLDALISIHFRVNRTANKVYYDTYKYFIEQTEELFGRFNEGDVVATFNPKTCEIIIN